MMSPHRLIVCMLLGLGFLGLLPISSALQDSYRGDQINNQVSSSLRRHQLVNEQEEHGFDGKSLGSHHVGRGLLQAGIEFLRRRSLSMTIQSEDLNFSGRDTGVDDDTGGNDGTGDTGGDAGTQAPTNGGAGGGTGDAGTQAPTNGGQNDGAGGGTGGDAGTQAPTNGGQNDGTGDNGGGTGGTQAPTSAPTRSHQNGGGGGGSGTGHSGTGGGNGKRHKPSNGNKWTNGGPSMSDLENQGAAVAKDPNVWIAAVVLSVVGFFFLLFVVHQLVENPQGCISKLCRCMVAFFRIMCWPCRRLCCWCCPGGSQARSRGRAGRTGVPTDDDDNYSRDLELT
jgi:hypothetical protein